MDSNTILAVSLRRHGSSSLLQTLAYTVAMMVLLEPRGTLAVADSGEGGGDGSSSGSGADTAGSVPLNFIFLSSDNPRLRTSGSIPAVDIALEMVAKSRVLGKYRLQYTEPLDSQVSVVLSARRALEKRIKTQVVTARNSLATTVLLIGKLKCVLPIERCLVTASNC